MKTLNVAPDTPSSGGGKSQSERQIRKAICGSGVIGRSVPPFLHYIAHFVLAVIIAKYLSVLSRELPADTKNGLCWT